MNASETNEIKKIFSTNLKYWLNAKGKDQAYIAKITGVSEASAHYWVNGIKVPRMDKIKAIADGLGIDVSNLLYENVEYKPISNNHLKYILFGDIDVSDEKLKDVLDYAKYIKNKN